MSLPRRPAVVGAVLALALGIPGVAGADPTVPDVNIAQAVHSLNPDAHVFDIQLAENILPLETEEKSGAGVTVRLSSDVLFDFDKATLTDSARRRIAELAPRLRGTGDPVQVSGHSDSIGAASYNLRLSEQRAEAVKAELQRALGGASVRIEAKGYGSTKPVAPNREGGKDNPEGRAKNRRVDITFQKS